MTAFKTNKKTSVGTLKKKNDHIKRTKGSRISKKLQAKGLKEFTIDDTTVWAINQENAERKVKKIQQAKK